MEIKLSSFRPVKSLKEKNNYKPYYTIAKDGTIRERILLDISNARTREYIIFLHFMERISNLNYDILSRDAPWDFKVSLTKTETVNIEITSIAEDNDTFRRLKNEDFLMSRKIKEKITFRDLKKLNFMFPNQKIENLIAEHEANKIGRKALVSNPYHNEDVNLFLGNINDEIPTLNQLIKSVIEKKEAKQHPDKGDTIIIIDNKTVSYEEYDLFASRNTLSKFLATSTFKEIWFYTGYYSDLDGNNAEFHLFPLKSDVYT